MQSLRTFYRLEVDGKKLMDYNTQVEALIAAEAYHAAKGIMPSVKPVYSSYRYFV